MDKVELGLGSWSLIVDLKGDSLEFYLYVEWSRCPKTLTARYFAPYRFPCFLHRVKRRSGGRSTFAIPVLFLSVHGYLARPFSTSDLFHSLREPQGGIFIPDEGRKRG